MYQRSSVNIKKQIQAYWWTIPFILCIIGYTLPYLFTPTTVTMTPCIVYQSLPNALQICSKLRLNLQIIHEQATTQAPQGYILQQKPAAGSPIKEHQTIFITIATLPEPAKAPNCTQVNSKKLEQIEKEEHIKIKTFQLATNKYQHGQCIAQIPQPEQPITDKKMVAYLAVPTQELYVCPNIKGQNLAQAKQFCLSYKLKLESFMHNNKVNPAQEQEYTIIDQKPLPGSFIHPTKDIIQVHIEKQ